MKHVISEHARELLKKVGYEALISECEVSTKPSGGTITFSLWAKVGKPRICLVELKREDGAEKAGMYKLIEPEEILEV